MKKFKNKLAGGLIVLLLLQTGCGKGVIGVSVTPEPKTTAEPVERVEATDTPAATNTGEPSYTPTPTVAAEPTKGEQPANTVTPTEVASTSTPIPTEAENAETTDTPVPTEAVTGTPAVEPTMEVTPAVTDTPAPTVAEPTDTPVPTEAASQTSTPVPIDTATPAPTATIAPTQTPEATATATPTVAATTAPTVTPTVTVGPTKIPTAAPTPTNTPIPQSAIEAERKAILENCSGNTQANVTGVEQYTYENATDLENKIKYLVFNNIECYDINNNLSYSYPQIGVFFTNESDIITPSQIMEKFPEAGKVFVPVFTDKDTGKNKAVQQYANGTLVFYCATPVEEDARIRYYYRTGDSSVFWDMEGYQNGDGAADWAVVNAIAGASKELGLSDLSKIEVIKKVHDYLVTSIKYDSAEASRSSSEKQARTVNIEGAHTAYAAIINNCAVCDGYAKAFQLFMAYNGIPCINVSGIGVDDNGEEGNHEWNQVYYNGHWYQMDCTWDDPLVGGTDSGRIYYDYFMLSDNVMLRNHSYSSTESPNTCDDDSYMYYPYGNNIIVSADSVDSIVNSAISNQDDSTNIYLVFDKSISTERIVYAFRDKWNSKVGYVVTRDSEKYDDIYSHLIIWKSE